jgi:hypothetical protein
VTAYLAGLVHVRCRDLIREAKAAGIKVKIDPMMRSVMVNMAWHAGDAADPVCRVGDETLAELIGTDRMTAQRARQRCIDAGYVDLVQRHKGRPSTHRVVIVSDRYKPDNSDRSGGEAQSSIPRMDVRLTAAGGAAQSSKGCGSQQHESKSSLRDPRGAKRDDDRGTTGTPKALRPDVLDAIVDGLVEVDSRDAAAQWAHERFASCKTDGGPRDPNGYALKCLRDETAKRAKSIVAAARAKRALHVATEQETAEADRLEQQRRKRAEQLAHEHEKANALERYRVEAAARAEAERVEDNKRRATLGLPLLEPGESVYGNRKAQP